MIIIMNLLPLQRLSSGVGGKWGEGGLEGLAFFIPNLCTANLHGQGTCGMKETSDGKREELSCC